MRALIMRHAVVCALLIPGSAQAVAGWYVVAALFLAAAAAGWVFAPWWAPLYVHLISAGHAASIRPAIRTRADHIDY